MGERMSDTENKARRTVYQGCKIIVEDGATLDVGEEARLIDCIVTFDGHKTTPTAQEQES